MILMGQREAQSDHPGRKSPQQVYTICRRGLTNSRSAHGVKIDMALTKNQEELNRVAAAAGGPSRGLQWLWQHLSHLRHPHCFECGPIYQSTLDVLLLRGAKLYLSDLITPAQKSNSEFWSLQGKTRVFLVDDFLAQIPPIPSESLSAICCWGLLDLLPREALPPVVERFHSFLQPNGVLFSILREPHITTGAESHWWFESLTLLGSSGASQKPFPYPALTNREMERLFPGGNVKTFLTRSGRREVLGVK